METYALDIIEIVLLFALGLLVKFYLPSYVNKKAENLATKEDIGAITRIVESNKAVVESLLHVNKFRYEKEYEILSDLSEKLVDLRDAGKKLRPILEFYDPDKSEDERKAAKLEEYQTSGRRFYHAIEKKKPFYPKELYKLLTKLNDLVWKEVIAFKSGPEKGKNKEYWEDREKNIAEINNATEKAREAIRNRVQQWEEVPVSM